MKEERVVIKMKQNFSLPVYLLSTNYSFTVFLYVLVKMELNYNSLFVSLRRENLS